MFRPSSIDLDALRPAEPTRVGLGRIAGLGAGAGLFALGASMARPAALMNRAALRGRILKLMRTETGKKLIARNPRLAKMYMGAEATQYGDFVHDYTQAARSAIGGNHPAGWAARAYFKHLDKNRMSPLRGPLTGKNPVSTFGLSHYRRMGMQGPWDSLQHWNWEKDLLKNHGLAKRHGYAGADAMGRAYGNNAVTPELKKQLQNVYGKQGEQYQALQSRFQDILNTKFVNHDQALRQLTRDPELQDTFRRMALMNLPKAAPRYGRYLAAGAGTGMLSGGGLIAANLRHVFPENTDR